MFRWSLPYYTTYIRLILRRSTAFYLSRYSREYYEQKDYKTSFKIRKTFSLQKRWQTDDRQIDSHAGILQFQTQN